MSYGGTTELTLDAKGRFAIPARHRAALMEECQGALIVCRSLDSCLWVFPATSWKVFSDKLMGLPSLDARNAQLQRHFIGSSESISMDKQGRVQLTPYLREKAGLQREIFVVGRGDRFELWDAAAYTRYEEGVELDASYMQSVGI